MTDTTALKSRFIEVKQRIAAAAERSGRGPETVHLVAVTKYAAIDQIRELVQLGHRDLGENHVANLLSRSALVDEWAARSRTLPSSLPTAGLPDLVATPIRWHLIGPVQTNKISSALDIVRLIHTVSNLRVAEALHEQALNRDAPCEILVQINASGELSKGGLALPAVPYIIETIESMTSLRCRGIMTMAPHDADPEQTRMTFRRAREVFEDIRSQGIAGPAFDILSMGMSNDYEIAISEGANIVRIGSSIFGDAPEPDAASPNEDRSAEAGGDDAPGSAEHAAHQS